MLLLIPFGFLLAWVSCLSYPSDTSISKKTLESLKKLPHNSTHNHLNRVNARCRFDSIAKEYGVVAVTPELENGGWAMSPNQMCKLNQYCPYACKPGMFTAQYEPNPKCVNGPQCGSMNGGLYCDSKGNLIKPRPNRPLCQFGVGGVYIQNLLEPTTLCQTVYPGNEAMLITTALNTNLQTLINVPPNDYWGNTTAHYYLNFPKIQKCFWGEDSQPLGNWAPYVIGTGQAKDSNIYTSIIFNPLFLEKYNKTKAFQNFSLFDLRITGRNVLGLPCSLSKHNLKQEGCTVTSKLTDRLVIQMY